MPEVFLAKHAGFCFGVKRATKMAEEWLDESPAYSLGDLVHNLHMVNDFAAMGLTPLYDQETIKRLKNQRVVIRAHGITKELEQNLVNQGNRLLDTTCPLVKRVHRIVAEANERHRMVIIVGDAAHPEVIGIASYADCVIVLSEVSQVSELKMTDPITVVSQTTNQPNQFDRIASAIKAKFDDVEIKNTICMATEDRQEACRALAKTADVMIVLGGKHSSNTTKLAQVAGKYTNRVFHVESIDEIDLHLLKNVNIIGITAGASTPDRIIKEAISQMENLNNNEMMEAIESSFTRIRRGDIVKGEVLFVTDSEVMVNINYRSDGIIAQNELSNDPSVKPADLFKQGDEIEVYVLKIDDGDGNVVLSTKRVESMKNWDVVQELFDKEEEIEIQIQNVVKGGLTCTVEGLNAFMPASHVSANYVKDLEQFKGQAMTVKIIDFDKEKRRIIVSRKVVETKEIEARRKEVYSTLKEGEIVHGVVQRLTNFGAFVDLNGVDGLIHISELSWNRVKHPREVVQPGQEVDVYVISVDEEKNRIALGLKQTTEEPWALFERTIKVGDVVKGKIVNLLDFGAFVRLESGVDGLLHVSQISKEHVEKPADMFNIGDEVEVKVTDINHDGRKISLSIRALTEEPKKEEPKEKPRREPREPREPRQERSFENTEVYKEDDAFNTTIGDIFNIKLED